MCSMNCISKACQNTREMGDVQHTSEAELTGRDKDSKRRERGNAVTSPAALLASPSPPSAFAFASSPSHGCNDSVSGWIRGRLGNVGPSSILGRTGSVLRRSWAKTCTHLCSGRFPSSESIGGVVAIAAAAVRVFDRLGSPALGHTRRRCGWRCHTGCRFWRSVVSFVLVVPVLFVPAGVGSWGAR